MTTLKVKSFGNNTLVGMNSYSFVLDTDLLDTNLLSGSTVTNYVLLKLTQNNFNLFNPNLLIPSYIADNLIFKFNTEEGSGAITKDAISNLTGSLISGAGWTTGSISSYSIYFSSGQQSAITVPDSALIRPENYNAFSWSFWAKLNSTNNNVLPRFIEKSPHYMAMMGDSGNGKYQQVAIEVVQSGTGQAAEYWGNTDLQVGSWYHIVGCFNQNTTAGSIYINGSPETISIIFPWTGSILTSSSANNLIIGNRRLTTGSRNLDGELDDIRMYNKFLTPIEILSIYNKTETKNIGI